MLIYNAVFSVKGMLCGLHVYECVLSLDLSQSRPVSLVVTITLMLTYNVTLPLSFEVVKQKKVDMKKKRQLKDLAYFDVIRFS